MEEYGRIYFICIAKFLTFSGDRGELCSFSKSVDCLNFQSQLIIYIFKVYCLSYFQSLLIIYIFKSADCLHFQSQLMAWIYIFMNILLFTFKSIRKWHCYTKLLIWHEMMQFLTEGETRTGQQEIKSLEALLRDRA